MKRLACENHWQGKVCQHQRDRNTEKGRTESERHKESKADQNHLSSHTFVLQHCHLMTYFTQPCCHVACKLFSILTAWGGEGLLKHKSLSGPQNKTLLICVVCIYSMFPWYWPAQFAFIFSVCVRLAGLRGAIVAMAELLDLG